jgi:hypothetical protein
MGEKEADIRLRYIGDRFNGGRLPVDVVPDLAAFQDLILAFAKDRWRQLNTDRKRLPKGFEKNISLSLVAIEDGSAISLLALDRGGDADMGGVDEAVVFGAFNDIASLLDGAGGDRFPETLSKEHIRALNKWGAGLKQNERIELLSSKGSDGNVVFLDSYRRKCIITNVMETYEKRIEGAGTLVGLNVLGDGSDNGSIVVQTQDYGRLEIPVGRQEVESIYDGNILSNVKFDLIIELDKFDKVRSIKDIVDTTLLEIGAEGVDHRCAERLDELCRLPVGWNEGDGVRITERARDSARKFLGQKSEYSEHYRIYPTNDGGILIEFVRGNWDYSVELLHDGKVEFYGVEIDGGLSIDPKTFSGVEDKFFSVFDAHLGAARSDA